jgi:hypothetical protein
MCFFLLFAFLNVLFLCIFWWIDLTCFLLIISVFCQNYLKQHFFLDEILRTNKGFILNLNMVWENKYTSNLGAMFQTTTVVFIIFKMCVLRNINKQMCTYS